MLRYDNFATLSSPAAHSDPAIADKRAALARMCAAIIPGMRANGHSWNGFQDFTPTAVAWLRSNQAVVRDGKSYFERQRPSRQKADAMWARLAR